jgi:hypothetical protein
METTLPGELVPTRAFSDLTEKDTLSRLHRALSLQAMQETRKT